jgi:WD40 repeat protein
MKLRGHSLQVNKVAFTGEDQLVSASNDATVRIWDLRKRQQIDPFPHDAFVWSLAVSPDGQYLATGDTRGIVQMWDVAKRELRWKEPLRLALASYDDTVRLWDVNSERMLHSFTGHTADVWWVSFDHRDERLASAGADGAINVWSVSEKRLLHSLKDGYPVDGLTFSPDGQQIAACSGAALGELLLWDYRIERSPRRIAGNVKQARSLAFSPDGRQIAVGGKDGIARVWSVETGELAELRGHEGDVTCIAFSSDGPRIFTRRSRSNC